VTAALQQIADPDSALNRQWDEEHDRYVFQCLLDPVEEEFEPITLQAFRRRALDGASGAEAAREMGMSVAAVYVAKSRVLARIRQDAEGLIDCAASRRVRFPIRLRFSSGEWYCGLAVRRTQTSFS
jgi:RNA polymerase sigma-70 factor (ECF subfamily)